MNIEEEYNNLGKTNFWKPETGKEIEIQISGIPEEKASKFLDGDRFPVIQMHIPILVNGDELMWTVSKSTGKNSVWGRLITLAYENNEKQLKGLKVFIYAMGEKLERRYEIKCVDSSQGTLNVDGQA